MRRHTPTASTYACSVCRPPESWVGPSPKPKTSGWALCFDVGKVLIPKHIINKPALLTDEEYDLVKTHSMKGFELLSSATTSGGHRPFGAGPSREAGRFGIPRQVKGDSITDFRRMVAVADVYRL